MNVLDLLFPPRCALCGKGSTRLCPACARALTTDYRPRERRVLTGCTDSAAALVYRDGVRRLLIGSKYRDRTDLAAWGGEQVAACLARHADAWKPDLVTYTPTTLAHWWKRGFNLAQVLARRAAGDSGLPCVRTLRRSWFGRSQLAMDGAHARRRNAEHMYAPCAGVDLSGRRVVLVDDVLATGATAEVCIRALRQMGAAEVFFLCLAQTPTSAKK